MVTELGAFVLVLVTVNASLVRAYRVIWSPTNGIKAWKNNDYNSTLIITISEMMTMKPN